MIRVLIAEDSATARQVLIEAIGEAADMKIVGLAMNGAEAVASARTLHPSIVTMDIHMPLLDGYEATRQIMRESPVPILIVSSVANPDDSAAALNALRAGAVGLVAKPSGAGGATGLEERRRFIAQIRALADLKVVRRIDLEPRAALPRAQRRPAAPAGDIGIVALAASTGGPAVLAALVSALPPDLPVPLVVVQHNTRGFMPALAKWLNASGNVVVRVAVADEALHPGVLYIAPDDHQFGVTSTGLCRISDEPAIDGFQPSASFLFESIARAYGTRSLAVILSGMGTDGVAGLRTLHDAGGTIYAQSQASSVVWGMPGAAVEAGIVDSIIDLDDLAGAIANALVVRP